MNTAQILGFKRVEVTLRNGTTGEVQVRELTLGELTDRWASWRLSMADLPKLLDLVCSQKEGWSESLSLKSCVGVLKAADELNRGFFVELAEMQSEQIRQVVPGLAGQLFASGSPAAPSTNQVEPPPAQG